MKVMVVGAGGREHALVWALSQSKKVDALFCAPGNAGTDSRAKNLDVGVDDIPALVTAAQKHAIDLVVVGPEAPLMAGLADALRDEGIAAFGPSKSGARLEGSKVFAKEFMARHGIPTAPFRVFDDAEAARAFLRKENRPAVVKADGLAAGKGVYVCTRVDDALAAIDSIMGDRVFGDAGDRVLIEDLLPGEEVSVHVICANGKALLLPTSQDHKRLLDGDRGPNTGGMGAYAPVPRFGADALEVVRERVIEPALAGIVAEDMDFRGVLYAGLMWGADGPQVLEFNVRFGDPETQVLMPLIKDDVAELFAAAADGKLPDHIALWENRFAATVVMASHGYPGSYQKGLTITGLDGPHTNGEVFHAGTRVDDGDVVTAGGRVLTVTAWDDTLAGAVDQAYSMVNGVSFANAVWRGDIAHRAL